MRASPLGVGQEGNRMRREQEAVPHEEQYHVMDSSDHLPQGKPAPDVYLEARRRLGCKDSSSVLVVEDAVNGKG